MITNLINTMFISWARKSLLLEQTISLCMLPEQLFVTAAVVMLSFGKESCGKRLRIQLCKVRGAFNIILNKEAQVKNLRNSITYFKHQKGQYCIRKNQYFG